MASTTQGAGSVSVDGATLGYRIEGHGEPVLVIGSAVFYPRLFSPQLREHVRLVFADLRHFGTSDGSVPVDGISIDTFADDMEQVRQTLELGDVVVVGQSIHGCVALEYARRYPEHVRGVVATGTYAAITDERPSAVDRLWDAEASDERKNRLARNKAALTPEVRAALPPTELFVREYVVDAPANWYDPGYDPAWLWDGVLVDEPVIEHLFELFDPYDLAQGPGEITVPVLIAQGRFDFNAARTLWDEHRHKLPRHTYSLFDRSGHYPPLEEPERFDQTLLAWMRTL